MQYTSDAFESSHISSTKLLQGPWAGDIAKVIVQGAEIRVEYLHNSM